MVEKSCHRIEAGLQHHHGPPAGKDFLKKDMVPERNKVDLGSYKQLMKLFVAGLPYDFDDTDLKEMFELYGEVNSAKVAIDRETRKSRGFGFLDMAVALEAKEAIDALNGARLRGGKELVVREAEEKPRDNNRPRDNNSGGYRPRR
jgi:RNA recognition motif-containing protein